MSSTFTYEEDPQTGWQATRYTNSTGDTTTYYLNDLLQVIAEADPLGNTKHFEYDSLNQLLTQTDELGNTTHFEYDERGNLTGLVAPDGIRTTASYNRLDLPDRITERGGVSRSYTYDDRGNLREAFDQTGARTSYAYDTHGGLRRVENALGEVTGFTTDAAGLPIRITRPDGATATCARDAFGRITEVVDAVGGVVRQAWSTEGRLLRRELPDGSHEEWSWDGEGNLSSHTDRMGRVTHHSYGHFDVLLSTRTGEASDYQFTHDTELRLTQVANADGQTWSYTYDAAGRLAAERDFDGRTVTYDRDAVGRITRRTNSVGQTMGFDRDALGRVTRITHGEEAVSSFVYGDHGHVWRVENAHCRIELTRDAAGRIVGDTVNGATMSFTYDGLGRRTSRRTPSGAESRLEYGLSGLSSVSAGGHTFGFERDALGRETERTIDGELRLHQRWDSVGRLRDMTLQAGSRPDLVRSFSYQADGVRTAIEDSQSGRRTFVLDAASRVQEVRADGWTEKYLYNAAGDQTDTRVPAQAPGQSAAGVRRFDGTRLVRAGRTQYVYDAQGRLTHRRTKTLSGTVLHWHFRWDAEDRLTLVQTPEDGRWQYLYDALGRRMAKERTDDTGQVVERTTFRWDGVQLAEQHGGDITLVWDYTGGRPLCQREAKLDGAQKEVDRRFFAIITDLIGSPTELVTEEGSVAWRARSTVWGATQWSKGSTAYTPLRHPGQYFDPETGLHYNFNRFYDPEVGRYLSPDPLGIAPSINPYSYVVNPLVLSDPLGLAACTPDPTWGGQVRWVRDEHGRPYEMHAVITRNMLDEGTHANNAIIPPGYQSGKGQARGHMLARQLGGSGDFEDNLFTISQNPTNTPKMSMFEQRVYDAVADHDVVSYSVYLEYVNDDPDSPPKSIQLEAFGTKKDRDGNLQFDEGIILDNPAHDEPRPRRRP
ncbi:RHS repeat-associated core domain-containing protein [Streptomyces solincola]|nr:RHS repeat-associated core domain-containing protein [Streptomyces solincola]